MIIRVPSEQIAVVWDFVKPAVLNGSLKEGDEAYATFMLKKFLDGKIDLWIIYDEDKPVGVFTTAFILNCWGFFQLVILSLYGMGIKDELYQQSIEELKLFAKSKNCSDIVASTESNKLVEVSKKLGAAVRTEVVFKL